MPYPSPYVTKPPLAKLADVAGRAFSYVALLTIGVAMLIPGTYINIELQPKLVFTILGGILIASTLSALIGVIRNSYMTEAIAIGFVFLGFTPVLITALSAGAISLSSVTAMILSVTILIRWNYLNSTISQARKLKELSDARIFEAS